MPTIGQLNNLAVPAAGTLIPVQHVDGASYALSVGALLQTVSVNQYLAANLPAAGAAGALAYVTDTPALKLGTGSGWGFVATPTLYGGRRYIDADLSPSGVNIVDGFSGNAITQARSSSNPGGGVANLVNGGGVNGSPNQIVGLVNYSWIGGGYDLILEASSAGVLGMFGAHNRIFGNSDHCIILGGTFNNIYNGAYAGILSGTQHFNAGLQAALCGGTGNAITANANNGFLGGGTSVYLDGNASCILGGQFNINAGGTSFSGGGNLCWNFAGNGVLVGGASNQLGDGTSVTDGAISASGTTLTCATSTPFTAGMVGATVVVFGAGPASAYTTTGGVATVGAPLRTTISAFTDSGHVILALAASTAVTNARVVILTGKFWGDNGVLVGGGSNLLGTTANAQYGAIVGGNANSVQAQYGVAVGGSNNSVTAKYAWAFGNGALADHYACMHFAPGNFSAQGDCQPMLMFPFRQLVNVTAATELRLDGSGQRLNLNTDNSGWLFDGYVYAKATGGTTSCAWHFQGVITRGTGVGSVALKYTANIDVLWGDVSTPTLSVTADNVNGALSVKFTDSAGGATTWNVGGYLLAVKVAG